MKKITTFILLVCMVLSFTSCADKEKTLSEITLQGIYDSSNFSAMLETRDSVHVLYTVNGEVISEEYYSKEYIYSFNVGNGFEEEMFKTDHSCFINSDNAPARLALIAPDGLVDMKEIFGAEIEAYLFSTNMINDTMTSVTEKDGYIVVTSVTDQEEIDSIEGLVSWEEEVVLDAKTHEPISVKSTLLHNDEAYETVVTITYDSEIPEKMKKFVEYDQQTENMRTVTVVFNSGTEKEKKELVISPKGLTVGLTSDLEFAEIPFDVYVDASCTQLIKESPDVNSDVTVYIKWKE